MRYEILIKSVVAPNEWMHYLFEADLDDALIVASSLNGMSYINEVKIEEHRLAA